MVNFQVFLSRDIDIQKKKQTPFKFLTLCNVLDPQVVSVGVKLRTVVWVFIPKAQSFWAFEMFKDVMGDFQVKNTVLELAWMFKSS